ncbi:MAG: hypothetical protein J1F63_05040 [Oscillospiraceae bacterium]|nr:hypothetical protein [Oscillospiraceae bacterium]
MKKRFKIIIIVVILAVSFIFLYGRIFAGSYVGFCANNTLRRASLELSLGIKGRPDMQLLTNSAKRLSSSGENEQRDAAATELNANIELLKATAKSSGKITRVGREKREIGGKTRKFTVYKMTIPREAFASASEKANLEATSSYLRERMTESVEEKIAGALPVPLPVSAVHRMAEAAVDVVFPKVNDINVAERFMRDVEIRLYTRFGFLYGVEGYMESLAGVFRDVSFELQAGSGGIFPVCANASGRISGTIGEKELGFSFGERAGFSGGKVAAVINGEAVYGGVNLLSADAVVRHIGGRSFSVDMNSTALEYTRSYGFTGEAKDGYVTLYNSEGEVVKRIRI